MDFEGGGEAVVEVAEDVVVVFGAFRRVAILKERSGWYGAFGCIDGANRCKEDCLISWGEGGACDGGVGVG